MSFQFSQHYTRDQARTLLPQVQAWLETIQAERDKLAKHEGRFENLLELGHDVGGKHVNQCVRALAAIKEALNEFASREIQVKELDCGLVDFPSIMQGREVFLCWEMEEVDIGYWHDLDAGYAGRERLENE